MRYLLVLVLLIAGVSPKLMAAETPLAIKAEEKQTVLQVNNMVCNLCTITVKKALEATPGVLEAKVDFQSKEATVRYDPHKTDVAALIKATTQAGYPAQLK